MDLINSMTTSTIVATVILYVPRGLTARIAGFHPAGPGLTPGVGTNIYFFLIYYERYIEELYLNGVY